MTIQRTWPTRYVVTLIDKSKIEARVEVLRQHGVPCRIVTHRHREYREPYTCWSIYTLKEKDVGRAREICRGFREGFNIRGDVFDFLLGLRAAMYARQKAPQLMESVSMLTDSRRLKR